ncbi:hypothetical protein BSG1_20079, partial [Bacillus sp. SG-1]
MTKERSSGKGVLFLFLKALLTAYERCLPGLFFYKTCIQLD